MIKKSVTYSIKVPMECHKTGRALDPEVRQCHKITLKVNDQKIDAVVQHPANNAYSEQGDIVHWPSGRVILRESALKASQANNIMGGARYSWRQLAQKALDKLVERNGPNRVLVVMSSAQVINEKLEKVIS